MDTELQMAMRLASTYWPGTSLLEGAEQLLAEIYGPHEHIFECVIDGKKHCTRCWKQS